MLVAAYGTMNSANTIGPQRVYTHANMGTTHTLSLIHISEPTRPY